MLRTMDRAKKMRTVTRVGFTRIHAALQEELIKENPQVSEIFVKFEVLREKAAELERLNGVIFEFMADTESSSEQEMNTEMEHADEYRLRYQAIKRGVATLEQEERMSLAAPSITHLDRETNVPRRRSKRGFKLPKIELKTYNGDFKEWLQFLSQFKKIHEDPDMYKEDKFEYLVQAMVPNTRASDFVKSYPPTADNYDKVIEGLKNKFGKNELLVEVCVRELLKLVLSNAMTPKGKIALSSLFDKLETQLRSLESLEVTTATCTAMLYPLVESSLPEELLRVWQRHSSAINVAPRETGEEVNNPRDRLTELMLFLQKEVENEERIIMAVNGFCPTKEPTKDKGKSKQNTEGNEVATASALLATKDDRIQECLFCGEKHSSIQCERARKLSFNERVEIVKKRNACFNCLRTGHNSRFCKLKQKCAWCGKRHVLLMCREMSGENSEITNSTTELEKRESAESSLADLSLNTEVFLPTLRVRVHNGEKGRIVRAIVDTASHRSYILSALADEMNYEIESRHEVIHLLFGGSRSESVEHKAYRIRLRSIDDTFACNFIALDQVTICRVIPGIASGSWTRELENRGIKLTDIGKSSEPISILIGADVAGKWYTGRMMNLDCGTTAMETRLGWTVIGKTKTGKSSQSDATMLSISIFAREAKVSDLWSHDVIGIMDPIQTKKKEIIIDQVRENFRETLSISEDGRYELFLPRRENHPPLTDNKDMAVKRLFTITKKLKGQGLYEDYRQVFREWEKDGIIEEVPLAEESNKGYYLPHRPVLKENSTTRLRPVFDASAHTENSPSLNQCLEVGPNLIELISRMLLRFRDKKIWAHC